MSSSNPPIRLWQFGTNRAALMPHRASNGLFLEDVAPKLVPGFAGKIRNAPVLLEEFVRHLEHCQHQAALGRAGNMAAGGFAPDEFTGADTEPFRWTFLIDQPALEHVSLLDLDVFVVRQHRARREAHQGSDESTLLVEQQTLHLAAGKPRLLPFLLSGPDDVGMGVEGVVLGFGGDIVHVRLRYTK